MLVALLIHTASFGSSANKCPGAASSSTALLTATDNVPLPQSPKQRFRLYAHLIRQLSGIEYARQWGDRLHEIWQETNTYRTRYKLMEDQSGVAIRDLEQYFKKNAIPDEYKKFYLKNGKGDYEEDIKQIPNRYLAFNNQKENFGGARIVLRELTRLLVAAPRSAEEAERVLTEILQRIHADWLERNKGWVGDSYPREASRLSPETQITNAYPLLVALREAHNPGDPHHALILSTLDKHLSRLQVRRMERFSGLPVGQAYLEMVVEKGMKPHLDPAVVDFFDSKLRHKELGAAVPTSSSPKDFQEFYAKEFEAEILQGFPGVGRFSLKAPSTNPGSGAHVLMIRNENGETVGAIKVQSRKAGGLNELLSSSSVEEFLRANRSGVNTASILDKGVFGKDAYFMIFQAAKEKDLEAWLSPLSEREVAVRAVKAAADVTAAFHGRVPGSVSKETFRLLRGNALYDWRQLNDFLNSSDIEAEGKANQVPTEKIADVRKQTALATTRYKQDLDENLTVFRPSTTHGDLHAGNVFFDVTRDMATIIDIGTMTWTLPLKGQQGSGDPGNDIGRMMGHLFIEGLKEGRGESHALGLIKTFYTRYLDAVGMEPGSPQEQVLRRSAIFYVNRYFKVQLSDKEGVKFKSSNFNRPTLVTRLFDLWSRVDSLLGDL